VPAHAVQLDQLGQRCEPGIHFCTEPGEQPVPAVSVQEEVGIQYGLIVVEHRRPHN